jgi:hypothetical protein
LGDRVVAEEVEAVTLQDVFARAPRPVDVLQIDAEGFDAEIIDMLSGISSLPAVVRFEHRTMRSAVYAQALAQLREHGFRFAMAEDDTLAVRWSRGRGATAVD